MTDACQENENNTVKVEKGNITHQGANESMIDLDGRSTEVVVWKLMVVLTFVGMMADVIWVLGKMSTEGVEWFLANGIFFLLLLLLNCYARCCCKVCWRLLEAWKCKNALATAFDRYLSEFNEIPISTPKSFTSCTASARLAEIIIENLADDPSKRMFE